VTVDGKPLLQCRGVHRAIVACTDKVEKADCSYTAGQKEVAGKCVTKVMDQNTLVCNKTQPETL